MVKNYLKRRAGKLILLLALFLPYTSCSKSQKAGEILEIPGLEFVERLPSSYAREFSIDYYKNPLSQADYSVITVSKTDRYLLLPKKEELPSDLPEGIQIIYKPVENAFICASSAMALISRINSLGRIKYSAIQEKDWYVKEAADAMNQGSILYAGKYNSPDFELLLKGNCSLSIESTMIYHAPQIKEKLESLSIPVFVDKSSYEENPLGRMEWIKLYGEIFDKIEEADSFFSEEIKKINEIIASKKEKSNSSPKTVSFFYTTPNGLVVIRGSNDYIPKMIEMAGGKYSFSNTRKKSSPSVTISMEQFYAQCADSDILIYNSTIDNTLSTKEDLLKKSPLFAQFKAFQNDNIWTTGRYLYQATDRMGDMIFDLNSILENKEGELNFLEKVE